jgi:hypothetical protein
MTGHSFSSWPPTPLRRVPVKFPCYLVLVAAATLALPAAAQQEAEGTLVVTLRGLPPPTTTPPPDGAHPGYPAYRQPPAQASPPPQPRRQVVARLGICEQHGAPIFRGRNGDGRLLSRVPQGQPLAIKSEWGDWYAVVMVDNTLGWIHKSAVRMLEYNVVRPLPTTPDGPPPGIEGLAQAVLQEAFTYRGVPYVWGGNTKSGLDCSGLVKNCFARCGIALPRRASQQALVGTPVPLDLAQLQPGDRLYFAVSRSTIDHTGIYVGNGQFIHASMSRGRVAVDSLSKPLFGKNLVAARRS